MDRLGCLLEISLSQTVPVLLTLPASELQRLALRDRNNEYSSPNIGSSFRVKLKQVGDVIGLASSFPAFVFDAVGPE